MLFSQLLHRCSIVAVILLLSTDLGQYFLKGAQKWRQYDLLFITLILTHINRHTNRQTVICAASSLYIKVSGSCFVHVLPFLFMLIFQTLLIHPGSSIFKEEQKDSLQW